MTKKKEGPGESRAREAVIDGARRLFRKFGHEKTSVGEIAGEAGLSKATVYNHFRGKEEIVEAVLERERRQLIRRLRRTAGEGENPLESFRAFFLVRAREIRRLHRAYGIGKEDIIRLMSLVSKAIERSRNEEEEILADLLKRGAEKGLFRPFGDYRLTADLLFSSSLGTTFPLFSPPGPPPEERLEAFIDMVLTGICSDSARRRLLGKENT